MPAFLDRKQVLLTGVSGRVCCESRAIVSGVNEAVLNNSTNASGSHSLA